MGNKKTVLIVDSGGRGAVLIQKYSQSRHVGKLIAVPGNGLMQLNSKKPVTIFPQFKTTSIKEIVEICKSEKVDLVDVVQDNAVEAGLSDRLTKEGILAVGPTKAAGRIEWDKAWARDFMKKYKIPSPSYKVFNSVKKAKKFINKNPNKKFFVKAAGLAEGKGAIPSENKEEAYVAIDQMSKFGKAGETFVIEDWLSGEEFSMFAITDGKNFKVAGYAQDHKRLYDGDLGPNTGGMGCVSPPLVVNRNVYKQSELIIKKTIEGMAKEGIIYRGILYLGAMVARGKVFVIEFNSRWGDPEAEVLVPGILNDFYELGLSVVEGSLSKVKLRTDGKTRVCVTGSLRPGVEAKKRQLFGLNKALSLNGITIYGSRIALANKKHFVSQGRLFHLVSEGKDVIEARRKAYEAMSMLYIEGNNLHFRTDIGWRDLERKA